MVASVDEGGPPLKPLDEETEEVRLIWIIEAFDGSLGNYAAIVLGMSARVRSSCWYCINTGENSLVAITSTSSGFAGP